jgi:hypothetical protein
VDLTVRPRASRAGLEGARRAASRLAEDAKSEDSSELEIGEAKQRMRLQSIRRVSMPTNRWPSFANWCAVPAAKSQRN